MLDFVKEYNGLLFYLELHTVDKTTADVKMRGKEWDVYILTDVPVDEAEDMVNMWNKNACHWFGIHERNRIQETIKEIKDVTDQYK